ncbi:aminotransferase class I/II-fold pyridoxal phosphate-dependent enzyme [Luteimonas yindakuii]|uniref:cysteine-S-conjugate beta-lyase n=1 Tax=Luteimonas yindakuii TaxID=2565782 RepID=A0A4Z1RF79_9GAMM|nr:aminotransferase class I/II-fold pyridoxal phosphate-dependent enzyme [Luteimonas yindakuii]TKS54813.1 aminotransferase class I/II-fold pyridoxal phosphate-dependent enzyme [Luteimonas yindakuii]
MPAAPRTTVDFATRIDALTHDQLRASGGLKWNAFPDCIGAFVAEMDFGIAPPIDDALHAAIADGRIGYLSTPLTDALAEACAGWHAGQYDWAVDPAHIHPLPDVLTGLELALQHLLPAGAAVVLPTPNYMPFLPLLRLLGHRVIEVPMLDMNGNWRFDEDGLDDAFAQGGKLLILCNPHNPLGRVYTRDELERLSAIVARHDARVFSDEIHGPLVFAPHRHVPYASLGAQAAAQAITATSASKGWNLAGLKCAQLILTNHDDQARWRAMEPFGGHATSTLGVIANTVAYRDGGAWLSEALAYIAGNRALLGQHVRERMPGIACREPEGTYLAWLDCRDLGPGPHAPRFRTGGVALTDGADCGRGGEGFVRMNFAMPRPLLEEALARMTRAVDGG